MKASALNRLAMEHNSWQGGQQVECTKRRTKGTKNAVYAKLVIWTKVEKSSNTMENTVTIQEQSGSHGDEPAQKLK